MTIEELKKELLGKEYPEKIIVSKDMTVINADKFLTKQFYMCDHWEKPLEKSPAYLRLMKFLKVVKKK
ncbi:DUF6965 family protein [Sphingobacterium hungaricum]|uniref:DUF6965 domain-containing protein n=1 Tax=Sphingobacterium hungaricum TaxID=2082723 RepID=A0A928UVY8_9SPHI|nr:hypothetical protein [Sphingobacterium hungaricum]